MKPDYLLLMLLDSTVTWPTDYPMFAVVAHFRLLSGVPQGSDPRTLLFSVFINGL